MTERWLPDGTGGFFKNTENSGDGMGLWAILFFVSLILVAPFLISGGITYLLYTSIFGTAPIIPSSTGMIIHVFIAIFYFLAGTIIFVATFSKTDALQKAFLFLAIILFSLGPGYSYSLIEGKSPVDQQIIDNYYQPIAQQLMDNPPISLVVETGNCPFDEKIYDSGNCPSGYLAANRVNLFITNSWSDLVMVKKIKINNIETNCSSESLPYVTPEGYAIGTGTYEWSCYVSNENISSQYNICLNIEFNTHDGMNPIRKYLHPIEYCF